MKLRFSQGFLIKIYRTGKQCEKVKETFCIPFLNNYVTEHSVEIYCLHGAEYIKLEIVHCRIIQNHIGNTGSLYLLIINQILRNHKNVSNLCFHLNC